MACCDCCDRPGYQNFNRWVLLVLSLISWAFTITGVAHCSFWLISASGYSEEENLGVGLFKIEFEDGACEKIPDEFVDFSTTHTVGRVFGALAACSTGLALVGIVMIMFFLPKGKGALIVWNITRSLYILSGLFALATFAFIKDCVDEVNDYKDEYSDYTNVSFTCELGAAGIVQGLAVWILLGVSITSFCTPLPEEPMVRLCDADSDSDHNDEKPPRHPQPRNAPQNDMEQALPGHVGGNYEVGSSVKTTIEFTPEGRKITETVTKPDGSRVITETVEVNSHQHREREPKHDDASI